MPYTYHPALTGTPDRSREGGGSLKSEPISEAQDGLQLIRLIDDQKHGQVNLRLINGREQLRVTDHDVIANAADSGRNLLGGPKGTIARHLAP